MHRAPRRRPPPRKTAGFPSQTHSAGRRGTRRSTGLQEVTSHSAPKKHFGQHFLTAPYYAERIAKAIPAGPGDRVLEIGPGRGALTAFLVPRFPRLALLEIDSDVIPVLRDRFGADSFELFHADAVKFDYEQAGMPLHIVGNLPYGPAAHIIHRVLEYGSRIVSCTFMVQKEVADRICASPHSRTMGYLSVFCQFFGAPRILFRVPPGAFFPKPNVESAVFQLVIDSELEAKLPRNQWDEFFALVDLSYRMRRKQLVNTLKREIGREKVEQAVAACGILPSARPEDLSVEQWISLFRSIQSI